MALHTLVGHTGVAVSPLDKPLLAAVLETDNLPDMAGRMLVLADMVVDRVAGTLYVPIIIHSHGFAHLSNGLSSRYDRLCRKSYSGALCIDQGAPYTRQRPVDIAGLDPIMRDGAYPALAH